jgi:hypothetical protein
MTAQLELELFAARPDETPPAQLAGSAPVLDLAAAVAGIAGSLAPLFDGMEWADDEIRLASLRHPDQADRLYHAFALLRPTHDRMSTEFVYRAHARELLNRVAVGGDTRPGTNVEVVCALMATSMLAPLRSSAVGLYMRLWQAAGLPDIGEGFAEDARHHEALEASTIDDHEAFARGKLADPARRLGNIECKGWHHGEPTTTCRYARPVVIEGVTS